MWDDHRTVSSFNSDDILVRRPLPSVCAGQAAAQCRAGQAAAQLSVLVKRVPRLRWWMWHQVWHRHSVTPQFQNGVFGSCQLWNQTEKMTAMIKNPPLVPPSRTQLSPISYVNPRPPPAPPLSPISHVNTPPVTNLPRQPPHPRCHPSPTSTPPPPLSPISHVNPRAVTHLPRQTPSCHPPPTSNPCHPSPTSHPQLSPISHVTPPAVTHLPRHTPS